MTSQLPDSDAQTREYPRPTCKMPDPEELASQFIEFMEDQLKREHALYQMIKYQSTDLREFDKAEQEFLDATKKIRQEINELKESAERALQDATDNSFVPDEGC